MKNIIAVVAFLFLGITTPAKAKSDFSDTLIRKTLLRSEATTRLSEGYYRINILRFNDGKFNFEVCTEWNCKVTSLKAFDEHQAKAVFYRLYQIISDQNAKQFPKYLDSLNTRAQVEQIVSSGISLVYPVVPFGSAVGSVFVYSYTFWAGVAAANIGLAFLLDPMINYSVHFIGSRPVLDSKTVAISSLTETKLNDQKQEASLQPAEAVVKIGSLLTDIVASSDTALVGSHFRAGERQIIYSKESTDILSIVFKDKRLFFFRCVKTENFKNLTEGCQPIGQTSGYEKGSFEKIQNELSVKKYLSYFGMPTALGLFGFFRYLRPMVFKKGMIVELPNKTGLKEKINVSRRYSYEFDRLYEGGQIFLGYMVAADFALWATGALKNNFVNSQLILLDDIMSGADQSDSSAKMSMPEYIAMVSRMLMMIDSQATGAN